jgi:hypothetical protein
LVIQLGPARAICIEAKWESDEGAYPTTSAEKKVFKDRHLKTMTQRTVQKYMMEDLLGIKTKFCYLVRKRIATEPESISWYDAFKSLDTTGLPSFITNWIKSLD